MDEIIVFEVNGEIIKVPQDFNMQYLSLFWRHCFRHLVGGGVIAATTPAPNTPEYANFLPMGMVTSLLAREDMNKVYEACIPHFFDLFTDENGDRFLCICPNKLHFPAFVFQRVKSMVYFFQTETPGIGMKKFYKGSKILFWEGAGIIPDPVCRERLRISIAQRIASMSN